MSEAELFAELANLVETDPFALIGVSISADEKRIAKRYRTVAKQLHPDALANASTHEGITPTQSAQLIARIVNPSYQKLKHEKSRQETLSLLRLRVLRLARHRQTHPHIRSRSAARRHRRKRRQRLLRTGHQPARPATVHHLRAFARLLSRNRPAKSSLSASQNRQTHPAKASGPNF